MENEVQIIFVDIDETICDTPKQRPRDYNLSTPIRENIEKINKLYDKGHRIVYWTARGSLTGIDWFDLTEKQLREWGCKYHILKCDKPYYDLFIDDKAMEISKL